MSGVIDGLTHKMRFSKANGREELEESSSADALNGPGSTDRQDSLDMQGVFRETLGPLAEVDEAGGDGGGGKEREGWDNKVQFLLSVIGYAVGLGNVWRFPYLCQQNGGGAFLIPYCIMMVLEGAPVFLIEMGIGQRLRSGSIGVWNQIHPYLGGVGISSAVVSFLVALYYNVIITWCLFYLFNSFSDPLPWATCPRVNVTEALPNGVAEPECEKSSETSYYWYRTAIDTTPDINHFGGLNWKMTLCLIAAWLIVWVSVMKGIKSSGKVMYATSTFPYIVTTIFLIRSLMLPGAGRGLAYMFTPDMAKLADPRVWLDAASQIFYSMGLAFGGLIAFSSYNPPKNDVKRDVITLSIANIVTSMYTAFVIFAILGYKGHLNYDKCMQHNVDAVVAAVHGYADKANLSGAPLETFKEELLFFSDHNWTNVKGELADWGREHYQVCDFNKIIKDAAEGTGLAFIVFTQAMVEFPISPLWAVMFFLMLLSLGLGSMFGTLEGVITSIYDLHLFTWLKKPVLTGILCGFSCIVGLIFVTRAGEYWVTLFDAFAGSYALMAVAFWEVIAVVYIYGYRRFLNDIEDMTGKRPGKYWEYTWRFISPTIMLVLFFASMIMSIVNEPSYFTYDREAAKLVAAPYPVWCKYVAGLLIFSAMFPVPFVAFIRYFKIIRFEPNIPASARQLNSTQSTVAMLKSQQSFNRLQSVPSVNTMDPSPSEVELTFRDPKQ